MGWSMTGWVYSAKTQWQKTLFKLKPLHSVPNRSHVCFHHGYSADLVGMQQASLLDLKPRNGKQSDCCITLPAGSAPAAEWEYFCQKQETCGEAQQWREEENKQKIRRKGVAVTHSRLGPWKVRWEEGGAEGTKPCLHNRTSRKEKVFQSSFEPYGLLFRGTVYVFCLSLDTAYFSKATLDLSNAPGWPQLYKRGELREGSIRWSACCEHQIGEKTGPSCCQKQVWPTKKRKPSRPGGNIQCHNVCEMFFTHSINKQGKISTVVHCC